MTVFAHFLTLTLYLSIVLVDFNVPKVRIRILIMYSRRNVEVVQSDINDHLAF